MNVGEGGGGELTCDLCAERFQRGVAASEVVWISLFVFVFFLGGGNFCE